MQCMDMAKKRYVQRKFESAAMITSVGVECGSIGEAGRVVQLRSE